MSNVTLGILGLDPRITVTVPNVRDGDPIVAMRQAKKRFGSLRITLIPRRDGEGWAVKPQGLTP